VRLTPAGKAFLHYGRLMLIHAGQLQDNLREYAKGIRGHVRVLANTTAIGEFLPTVLASFLAAHPDVSVDRIRHDGLARFPNLTTGVNSRPPNRGPSLCRGT
jgi:DNA-binding transcriptional LysR family regulator